METSYSHTFRESLQHAGEHWLDFLHQYHTDTPAVMAKRGHILRHLAWSFSLKGTSDVAAALVRLLHPHMLRAAPWSLWETYLKAALANCRAGHNQVGEIDILHHYGLLLSRWGRLGEALATATEAQELLADLGDTRQRVVNHARFSETYLNMGRYALASDHARAGADLAQAMGDDALLANALIDIGRAWVGQSAPASALEPLRRGLQLARRAGDPVLEGKAAVFLGHIHAAMENWTDAAAMHRLAYELTCQMGDRAGMGVTLKNVGLALLMTRQAEAARGVLQESIALSREAGNWPIATQALCYLSEVYRRSGRPAEAGNAIRQARQLVKKHSLEKMLRSLGTEGGKHAMELVQKLIS